MKPQRWLVSLLASIGITIGCHGSAQQTDVALARAFAQEKANAIRAGLPMNTHGFQAPSPPASENAAPLYRQLIQQLKADPLSESEKQIEIKRNRIPTDAQYQAIRSVLKRRAALLMLIHQATSRPKCVFVRNWSIRNPADIMLPEYASMREAARLLAAESVLLAHDGNPLDAVQNQALGFQIARHAAAEPTLISYLVGVALDTITLSGLQQILYLEGGKPEVAFAVQMAIEKQWRLRSLVPAMRGEVGFQMALLELTRQDGPKGLTRDLGTNEPPPVRIAPNDWNRVMDENGTLMLRRMHREIEAADRPFPEASRVMSAIGTEIQKDQNPRHFMCAILFPVYDQVAAKRAQIEAQANVTRSAAALLAWKVKHGAFPATLSEAISPVPADPFDGKPLRYQREGGGFMVYSVGKDGTFAGGSPDRKSEAADVLFRYPLPAYGP